MKQDVFVLFMMMFNLVAMSVPPPVHIFQVMIYFK